ncbi:MAG: hypothetical protein IT249_17905 [Chitinophagaceae bacterium]|nr:hypothetical protein [Chitinophagaceae bacterium]
MRILQTILILLFFQAANPAFSQEQNTDSALVAGQQKNTIQLYYNSLDFQSGLYNGSEYIVYVHLLKDGHPYLDTTTLTNGTVFYDGMLYSNVPMLYDIVKDELIVQHFNKVFHIQLVQSKVDEFNFLGRPFVHLGRDTTKQGNVKNGFYEILYDGQVKLYAKRIKTIQEFIPDMQVERRVFSNNRYFIYKDSVFHEVYNQSSVIKVLKDKRFDYKQALRKQHIKFRRQREAAMKLVLQQYDNANP